MRIYTQETWQVHTMHGQNGAWLCDMEIYTESIMHPMHARKWHGYIGIEWVK